MPATDTLPTAHTLDIARRVIAVERNALDRLIQNIDERFELAITLLESCTGRVIITGMGKSGIIGKKIAATFASTGTPAFFIHPGEGMHGDLGMMSPGDVVIAISNSGETAELLHVLPVVQRMNLPLIAMTGNIESSLAQRSQVVLDVSVEAEACPLNLAPTASTTATLALGDALAVTLMERKGFGPEDFAVFHPAGSLGKRLLLTVESVMQAGEAVPVVTTATAFMEALIEITSKKLGLTVVVDEAGRTCGIITDGDVRRTLTQQANRLTSLKAADIISGRLPKSIEKAELAVTALSLMEQHKITALVVNTPEGKPEGVVHLHDLLKTGI